MEYEKEIFAHSDKVLCVKFNYSGTILISGGDDKKIKIWDTKDYSNLKVKSFHFNKNDIILTKFTLKKISKLIIDN